MKFSPLFFPESKSKSVDNFSLVLRSFYFNKLQRKGINRRQVSEFGSKDQRRGARLGCLKSRRMLIGSSIRLLE